MRAAVAFSLLLVMTFSARSHAEELPARAVDLHEHLGDSLDPELRFRDQDGRSIRLGDWFSGGTPIIVVPAYYRCPMLCGLVLRGVVSALARLDFTLGKQYRALTISFDPRDNAETARQKRRSTLLALAGKAETQGEWPFLWGEEAFARRFTDQIGFEVFFDVRTEQYAHPAALIVLTGKGRISRYLYGVEFSPRDLRLSILEAGEGRVGTVADRVLLSCYRYDPASRAYGPFVLGYLRIGAVAILALVVAILGGLAIRRTPTSKTDEEGAR